MNPEVIYKLYPQIVRTEGDVAYDENNNVVQYDTVVIEAYIAANQYKQQRVMEYPSLADLADAMYWASKGDNTKLDNYYAACEAVKLKYPKS